MVSAISVPISLRLSAQRMSRARDLGKLIKGWRLEVGLSRREAVTELEKLGIEISYDYLNKLESGTRSLTSASVEIREGIRRMLRVSKEDWEKSTGLYVPAENSRAASVTEIEGYMQNIRMIPLYSPLSAGDGADGGTRIGEIAIPKDWQGTYAAYKVDGHSMEPDISSGDTVVAKVQNYAELGDTVVAYCEDVGMVVKELGIATEDQRRKVFGSKNPDYADILIGEGCKIIGKVVEVRRRL